MITASCHCGAVRLTVAERPARLTSCNCSLCRRVGALWDYRQQADVNIAAAPDATFGYIQGDGTLATHHCRICGCVTHWIPTENSPAEGRIAINARLMPPEVIAAVPIRHFDGADTWTYLD
jgi:hypothetical protein